MAKRFLFCFAAACLLVGGCDSLHARMIAQKAVSLYHRGQVREAAARFEEAAALAPSIATIQLDLGFANLAVYQADPVSPAGVKAAKTAIAAFEKFLELRPKEERAQVYLIQTFVDTGRYDEAVAFFKPMVEKSPPDANALNTLGIIASKTGKYDEAKKWYEKRIEVEPKNPDARLQLAVLIWDHLHNHTEIVGPDRIALADQAIADLAEAIKLAPKSPAGYTYTNLVYRERALGEPNDDGKRADLTNAQKFFLQGRQLQKGGR